MPQNQNRPGDVTFSTLTFNNTRKKPVQITVTAVSATAGPVLAVTLLVQPSSGPTPMTPWPPAPNPAWENIIMLEIQIQDPVNPPAPTSANPLVTLGTLYVAMPSPQQFEPQTYANQATLTIADWKGQSTPTCSIVLQDSSPTPLPLATSWAVVSDGVTSGFTGVYITNNMLKSVSVNVMGTTQHGTVVPTQFLSVPNGSQALLCPTPTTWVDIVEVSITVMDPFSNNNTLGTINASTPSPNMIPVDPPPSQQLAVSATLTLNSYVQAPAAPNATLTLSGQGTTSLAGATALAYIPNPS